MKKSEHVWTNPVTGITSTFTSAEEIARPDWTVEEYEAHRAAECADLGVGDCPWWPLCEGPVSFVVRCRYLRGWDDAEDGVGYLDSESRCTRDVRHAKTFENEADAWDFANGSGEKVPEDAWVETRAEAGS